MSEIEMNVQKFGYAAQVPTEVMDDARAFASGMDGLMQMMATIANPFASPEAKAAAKATQNALRAVAEERKAKRKAANAALMDRLREVCCPASLVVVELHSPDEDGDCGGCDVAGYEAEQPGWPCSTVDVIAEHYGVETEAL